MKIRTKLLGMFLLISLIPLLIAGVILSEKFSKESMTIFSKEVNDQIRLVDMAIDQYFNNVKENVTMLASSPVVLNSDETVTSYMEGETDSDGFISMPPRSKGGIEIDIRDHFDNFKKPHPMSAYVFMGLENGGYIQWPEAKIKAGYDPRKRGWYKTALKTPDRAIRTGAYKDASSSNINISTVKTIKDKNNEIIGVLAIDVSLKSLTEIISDVKIGEHGYMLMIDDQGHLLVNPHNPEFNFTTLGDLDPGGLGALNGLTSGEVEITVKGVPCIAQIIKSEKTGFIYAGVISKAEIADRSASMIRLMMIIFVVTALAASLIAFFAASSFVKPIKGVVRILKKQSRLDFRKDSSLEWLLKYKNDEIGEMITSLTDMESKIIGFVMSIAQEADLTDNSSRNLATLSEETVASMQEIKESVTRMVSLSEANSAALEETTAGIQEISSGATTAAQASMEGAESTELSANESKKVGESVRAVSDQINEVSDRSSKTMDVLNNVGESVKTITGFVDTITQIADQTNLLALNAAIEAARAGEHGRGFAVVAEEVRKLAEQSNEAAGKVGELIGNLQSNTRTSMDAMREVDQIVLEVSATASSTSSRIDEAMIQINKTNDAMQSIAAGAEEQAASSEEMAAGIDQVTESTIEISKDMNNVQQSTDETSQASEKVAQEAEQLSDATNRLKKLVEQFLIDD